MEHYDFVCDEGLTSLRLLQRTPADMEQPVEGLRIHVRCSDCVAGIDITAASWAGFVQLFKHDFKSAQSIEWTSPDGDWKLSVEKDGNGRLTLKSELDSLRDFHRWVLHTSFQMSEKRFQQTSTEVLTFIGYWQ